MKPHLLTGFLTSFRLTLSLSLSDLIERSRTPGQRVLDRPVKPGDDNAVLLNLNEKRSGLILP
jgi:hypothetical protein